MGPRRLEIVECESDLRVGGAWRIVQRAPDGMEFAFHGEFRELEPPHRRVATFVFEGAPEHEAVETLVLGAVEGGTMLTQSTRHDSVEARDMHVAAGMEGGILESSSGSMRSCERRDRWPAAVERRQAGWPGSSGGMPR